jgi:hypothetical protein
VNELALDFHEAAEYCHFHTAFYGMPQLRLLFEKIISRRSNVKTVRTDTSWTVKLIINVLGHLHVFRNIEIFTVLFVPSFH